MGKLGRRRRILFWSLISAGIIVILLVVVILVPNLIVMRSAAPFISKNAQQATHAEAAIILGAGLQPDFSPSPMLADRLKIGVELYKLGKVSKVLLSGAPKQVAVMLQRTLESGVPDQDIFTDYGGYNTYDTMYRAVNVYQVKTAVVVTQAFHISRAVYTARALGIDAVGIKADLQPYGIETGWEARDWLARVKAVMQLHLIHPHPATGPAIPIGGDGRASRQ